MNPWSAILVLLLGSTALLPQTGPASPSSIQEIRISVPGSQQAGVLCVPARHNARIPIVVLLGGALAGETSDNSNEFVRALALRLADAGLASIRFTNPVPGGLPGALPPSAQIHDAVAALNYGAGGLDRSQEFVLGYGLGATLAPYVAQQRAVRGVILLAPATAPIEDVLAEQTRRAMEQQHRPEEEIRRELASQNGILADIRAGKMPATRMFNGAPASYWADWMNRNPRIELQKLRAPILILQGGQDRRVSQDNYEKLQSSLNPRIAEFHWLPDLNHFFAQADKSAQQPINAQVIATIAGWMKRQTPDLRH